MRYVKYVLVLGFLVTACKAKKEIVTTSVKHLSARKVIKNHKVIPFDANTLDAKLKVNYSDNRGKKRKRYGFSVRLRMKKDSVIWLKGTYKVVSAFRVKITPAEFSYYSPLDKKYFTGDYAILKQMLGVDVSFQQLQNLFLGQSMIDLKGSKYTSEVVENAYKLSPKKQKDLIEIISFFYPNNFKLKKQLVTRKNDDKLLRLEYGGYLKKDNVLMPKKIEVKASEGERYTHIRMEFRSVQLNKEISTPYRIPKGYKQLKL